MLNEETGAPEAVVAADDGWEWAVVEIMGHRRHSGRTREVERFGVKLIRVDVPNKGDPALFGWTTHFYPGSALFSFTPADEAVCLKANKPYEPAARLTYREIEQDSGDGAEDDAGGAS